ncbi:MAG: sulfatase-like hydrolase/transferase, partial [Verrucomicrobiota bacterium]
MKVHALFWFLTLTFIGLLGEERPNVVWIISDDLSPELGCYGYPGVSTPHIDRLAEEGTLFTQAFST